MAGTYVYCPKCGKPNLDVCEVIPADDANEEKVIAACPDCAVVVHIFQLDKVSDRAWTDDGFYHEPKAHHPGHCMGCCVDPASWGQKINYGLLPGTAPKETSRGKKA